MSQSSELMRKYCDIIAVQEGVVRKAIKNMVDKPTGNIPGERAAGVAGAGVGLGLNAALLSNLPTSGNSTNKAVSVPTNQTDLVQQRTGVDLGNDQAGGGRGTQGMDRQAKPSQGVAVATDKGVKGTTTLPQGPTTADDLAHYSKGIFATRADRLNQAKVDSVLGPGYRAGSAEANRALSDYFRQERAREVQAKEADRILQIRRLQDQEQQELDQELAQRQSQQ